MTRYAWTRTLLLMFLFSCPLVASQMSLKNEDSIFTLGREFSSPLAYYPQENVRHLKRAKIDKRSTVLLNKLMYALHKAFLPVDPSSQQMELQRRGQTQQYWRCYFNAVSCFRRR